jgi:hypothetical protein
MALASFLAFPSPWESEIRDSASLNSNFYVQRCLFSLPGDRNRKMIIESCGWLDRNIRMTLLILLRPQHLTDPVSSFFESLPLVERMKFANLDDHALLISGYISRWNVSWSSTISSYLTSTSFSSSGLIISGNSTLCMIRSTVHHLQYMAMNKFHENK